MLRSQLFLAAGLFALPLLSRAAPAIPISNCQQIQQPGNYHLTQDLTATVFVCIVVAADNVTIHLDGHTIHGTGQGILAENVSNLSIFGSGTIEANVVGINALGVNGITVTNVAVRVHVDANAAISLIDGTANVTLTANTLRTFPEGQIGSFGILVAGANDSIVRANDVSGFSGGIVVDLSTGSIIQANTSLGNRVDMVTVDPCGANTWKSNTFVTFNGQCIQ